MLQKGFLSNREDGNNIRTVKISRMFIFAGIIIAVLGFGLMITSMEKHLINAGIVMIAGIALIFISLWVKFFAQQKTARNNH